jgi:hypothetical protein
MPTILRVRTEESLQALLSRGTGHRKRTRIPSAHDRRQE